MSPTAAAKLGSNIPAPTPDPDPPVAVVKTKPKIEYVKIVLEDTDRIPPTGQFIGINGKGYVLRPGEPAMVPKGVIDVLEHAIESHANKDMNNRLTGGSRQRMRFPYRLVSAAEG